MYGLVIPIASLRLGVIVMAPMPMSHFFAWKAAPEVTCDHSMLTTSCSTPRSLATMSSMSTSKPTTLLPSLNWKGLYGRWVQTVSLSGRTRVMPSALALLSAPLLPESPPQAVSVSANAATEAAAIVARLFWRVERMFIEKLLNRDSERRSGQYQAGCPHPDTTGTRMSAGQQGRDWIVIVGTQRTSALCGSIVATGDPRATHAAVRGVPEVEPPP